MGKSIQVPSKGRNTSIELLRIFFMFLILTIHVYAHGSHLNYDVIYSLGSKFDTAWNLSLFSFGNIGVTGFSFLSGYFGIKNNWEKIKTLLFICIFYYILLFLVSDIPIKNIVHIIHAYDYWWYVSAYLILVLLAPFIETGIGTLKKNQFELILCGLIYYTYIGSFINQSNSHNVILILTIYIIGRYLAIYKPNIPNKLFNIIGILSILVIILFPVVSSMLNVPSKLIMHAFIQNNNILYLIVSYYIVIWLNKKIYLNSHINKLASHSLAIYLITDFYTIRQWITPILLPSLLNGIGLIYILGICFICLIIDTIREKLFRFFHM